MPKTNTRLELTWIGKENRPKLEPRILVEDSEKSYHAAQQVTDDDLFDNRLIFGDNLLALKSLEQEFTGKIKCIYIDPPYNTGSAFTHYDDGVEHSIWLSLMRDRLELLRRLLTEDGSIWVNLDDNESHYCKVLMDEVFGRKMFVANCIWQKVYSERMDSTGFSNSHDHILVYGRTELFKVNQIAKDQKANQFNFFDETAKKQYRRRSLRKEGSESRREDRPSMWYAINAPDGSEVWPVKPDGTEGRWRWKKDNVLENASLLEFVKKEDRWEIYVKQYLDEDATRPPATFWSQDEVGHNHEAKLEAKAFAPDDPFGTPKPERLLHRVLTLGTNPGDWVLDSFAGSGTTGAVAHKTGRRWIMVELGEHCHTHIIPRMKKVIDGEDQGGISKAVNWKGGGGFRYYRLGPSLIVKDEWENPVINPEFNAGMLTEAMCKLEGFTFDPNADIYWQQGRSSETDFIYVTTQMMTKEMLTKLSDEVGPNRSLLICCGAFRCDVAQFENLTVKKIPTAVLKKCEWGHDDYSLEIRNLPVRVEEVLDRQDAKGEEKRDVRRFGKGKAWDQGPTLFDMEGLR